MLFFPQLSEGGESPTHILKVEYKTILQGSAYLLNEQSMSDKSCIPFEPFIEMINYMLKVLLERTGQVHARSCLLPGVLWYVL